MSQTNRRRPEPLVLSSNSEVSDTSRGWLARAPTTRGVTSIGSLARAAADQHVLGAGIVYNRTGSQTPASTVVRVAGQFGGNNTPPFGQPVVPTGTAPFTFERDSGYGGSPPPFGAQLNSPTAHNPVFTVQISSGDEEEAPAPAQRRITSRADRSLNWRRPAIYYRQYGRPGGPLRVRRGNNGNPGAVRSTTPVHDVNPPRLVTQQTQTPAVVEHPPAGRSRRELREAARRAPARRPRFRCQPFNISRTQYREVWDLETGDSSKFTLIADDDRAYAEASRAKRRRMNAGDEYTEDELVRDLAYLNTREKARHALCRVCIASKALHGVMRRGDTWINPTSQAAFTLVQNRPPVFEVVYNGARSTSNGANSVSRFANDFALATPIYPLLTRERQAI